MSGSQRTAPGSSGPHEFVEPDDPRMGLALGAGSMSGEYGPSVAQISVAGATLREPRCAMPGCGRLRDDPIHEVEHA